MLCEKCGNQVPDNVNFCTNCGNKISEGVNNKKNMKTKKIIFFGLLLCICLAIFISLSIKPKPEKIEKSDTEKILEYLGTKYSEEFEDIEFLTSVQRETETKCDGSTISRKKVAGDYTYYYKVYSKVNDMEFYAFIHKIKTKDSYSESISDNYHDYLARKKNATEILEEVEKTFNDSIKYSYVKKKADYASKVVYSNAQAGDVVNSMHIDINEEFGRLPAILGIKDIGGSYRDDMLPIAMFFKVNVSFKKLSNSRRSDLLKLTQFFENLPMNVKESFGIYIKTSDDYVFIIDNSPLSHDNVDDINKFSIEYYDPEQVSHKLNGKES